jgi:hypothetical protein
MLSLPSIITSMSPAARGFVNTTAMPREAGPRGCGRVRRGTRRSRPACQQRWVRWPSADTAMGLLPEHRTRRCTTNMAAVTHRTHRRTYTPSRAEPLSPGSCSYSWRTRAMKFATVLVARRSPSGLK